jgi:uncharacterized protein
MNNLLAHENTRKCVNDFLQFLIHRNSAIVDLFSEDVDWNIQGDTRCIPWLGKKNKVELRGFFETLWSSTEPIDGKIEHVIIQENAASISGNFTTLMLKTGKVVKSEFAIVMLFQNGLIRRYRLYEDSFAVSESMQINDPHRRV